MSRRVHNHDIDPSCRESLTVAGVLRGECVSRNKMGHGPSVPDGVEHYPGCPCGRCQHIRAAHPPAPAPLAYHACCAGSVKLTRTGPNIYTSTETHTPSCKEQP